MNKIGWLQKLKQKSGLQSQLIISVIFLSLIIVFIWSLNRYWQQTLKPRLHLAAETQAKVMAESQSAILVETLERTSKDHLKQSLIDRVQTILIVEDPAIGERFIRHVKLQIDYTAVEAEEGSLDLSEGDEQCYGCFVAEVPLLSHQGEILGIANFIVSDGYFRTLSVEMKSKLFAESSITLALVITVWIVMMVMFHRLHTAKQIVEASDLAKTRFMANVTHELRTPLNAILGYTQLYKQDPDMMQQYGQGIDTIDRSADHLLLMINDILEFSRANEESLKLHPTEINFSSFLNTLVEMSRVRARLKNLPFHHKFDASLPTVIIADDKRLRQILLNLLSNAVKFTDEGQVTFSVSLISRKATQARLRFSVADSGFGIARDQLHSIFIPFHQLDNAITRAEGSGLGLTISQRLIKLMNSKLQVKSKEGEGSHFWFELELPIVGDMKSETEWNQNFISKTEETVAFIFPEATMLNELKDQTKRHNVLGIRAIVKQMEQHAELSAFLEQIKPFIDNYHFKQMLNWLEQKENNN